MALNPTQFTSFINRLKTQSNTPTVTNQYLNAIQIDNIIQYLTNIDALNPTVLLVGEAPGYNGCLLSGIPFTSEYVIKSHNKSGVLSGCKAIGSQREASATIVWEKLDERNSLGKLSVPPLIWNIFPFHPHDIGNLNSNRHPVKAELILGLSILNDLLNLFPSIISVYAIGQVARDTINSLPQYIDEIRHPSFGGKSQFCKDIDTVYP